MAKADIVGRVKVIVFPDTDGFRRKVERDIDKAVADLDATVNVKPDFDNKHFNKQVRETIDVLKRLDRMRVNPKISEMRKDRYTEELSKRLDEAAESADRLNDSLDDVARHRDTSDWDRFSRKIDSIANDADRRLGRVGKAMDDSLDRSFAKTDKKLKDLADKARKTFEGVDFTRNVKVDFNRRDVEKRLKEIKERIATLDRTIKIGVTAGLDEDSLRDLKRKRDRIQHEIEVLQMTARLDDSKALAKLRRLKRERDGMDKQIEIGVHPKMDEEALKQAKHDYNHLKREMDDIDVSIIPDVNYIARKYAQGMLAWLTRPRRVKIIPDLDKKAFKAVATALAALSGGRALQHSFKRLWDTFKDLDKHVPKIAALSIAIGNLGSAALASTSNMLSLGGSIATMIPAALALPGILGGMAIGATITVLAFSDMNKVIPDAVQQWKDLKGTISDNFWAQAAKPIQNLTDVLMPQIVTGFTAASTAVGAFFGKFADAFTDRAAGYLVPMFEDLSKSIHIASEHADSFANIIMTLGEHGAGRLPQLAGWFGRISDRFSDFLTKASESGQLDEWIDRGIFAMKEFGRVISGASRILYHLSVAAEKAGGSTLTSLADVLDRIATTVATPAFQAGMVRTFKAAHDAMAAIADHAGPGVERFFINLSTILPKVLPSLGRSLGKLLGGIFDALSRTNVMAAFTRVIYSVEAAVSKFVPHLPDMADGFAGLLDIVGSLVEVIGPILGSALGTLGKIIARVAPSITKVIEALGPALLDVIDAIGPGLEDLAGTFADALPDMADALKRVLEALTPLLPKVLEFVEDMMPMWVTTVEAVALGLEALAEVIEFLSPIIEWVLEDLGKLVNLGMTPDPFTNFVVGADKVIDAFKRFKEWLTQLGPDVVAFGTTVKNVLVDYFSRAKTWLKQAGIDIATGLINGVQGKVAAVKQKMTDLKNSIANVFSNAATFLKSKGSSLISGLRTGIAERAAAVIERLRSLKQSVSNVFSNAATFLKGKGSSLISGLRSGIAERASAVTERLRSLKQSVSNVFSNASTLLAGKGRSIASSLRSGIAENASNVVQRIRDLRDSIKDVFSNASSLLYNAGYNIMAGLYDGIVSMVGTVKAKLNEITNLIPDWKGPAKKDATLLVNAGQLIMQSLIDGFESKFGAVKKSLGSLSDEIGGMEFATPDVEVGISNRAGAQASYRSAQSNTGPTLGGGTGGTNVNANIVIPNTDPNAAAYAVAHKLEGLARA